MVTEEFSQWRGFDLRERVAKLRRAFQREVVRTPEDVPLIINTPSYAAFGGMDKPADYFTNPASMVVYQEHGYEQHLTHVHDDCVPYFMPWFGTGVLASAFDCEIKMPSEPGDDPAVAGPCIHSPADAARLRLPDPYRDGWMPRVLDAMDYALAHSDLPVGLTDMQGPLDTLGLMCGQAQLYQWMYKEPKMIHDLLALVTEAFIDWVKVQKKHIGEPLERSNGLQGVYSPCLGVWESDDDLVLLDPGLYREFIVPCVSRIFEVFGGGSVHFCGNGTHHLENLLQIKNLRVVNNSPLGHFKAFAALRRGLADRTTIQIQDGAPVDVEAYYTRLFAEVDDFRGIMLASFVIDTVGMNQQGGYVPVQWEPFAVANRMVAVIRECVRKNLAGEPLLLTEPQEAIFPVAKPEAETKESQRRLTLEQEAALQKVRERLLAFDEAGIKAAVRAALGAGLRPFDIVVLGMAEAMSQVGRLYEAGEFFLPQLVMAGATMQKGMAILQPLLKDKEGAAQSKGTVVLGTVKGDLHDIGKNLVRMMLEGGGFNVVDLGVDVSPVKFVDAARAHNADIIAMSALLTTTMPSIKQTIAALQAAGLRGKVKVMIGGAPLSREFADQIGAEGYAPDAVKAVREAERLTQI